MQTLALDLLDTVAAPLQTGAIIAVCVLVVAAAVWDACTFEIPDTISVAVVVAFGVWLAARGLPGPESLDHLLTGAAVFAGGLLLFAARAFGGGDVKLLTAVGLWAGSGGIVTLLTGVALVGGLLCLALIAGRWIAARAAGSIPVLLRPMLLGEARVPYGIAIAAGTLILFLAPAAQAAGS